MSDRHTERGKGNKNREESGVQRNEKKENVKRIRSEGLNSSGGLKYIPLVTSVITQSEIIQGKLQKEGQIKLFPFGDRKKTQIWKEK